MVSFLAKRRKSINGGKPEVEQAPPMPDTGAGLQQQREVADPNRALEMPDLRFSKLDLDIDLSKIKASAGLDSRPGSVVAQQNAEPKRKSKMSFLGFGSEKASAASTEDLPLPRSAPTPEQQQQQQQQPVRNGQTDNFSAGQYAPSISTQSSMPASGQNAQVRDRKKLVASATEAMNLDVPVKAPSRQQSANTLRSEKSKKDLKKEEKEKHLKEKMAMEQALKEKIAKERERVAREKIEAAKHKEQAKLAAREAKETARREKEIAQRKSKAANSTRPIITDRTVVESEKRDARQAAAPPRQAVESTNVPSSRPKPSNAGIAPPPVAPRREGPPPSQRPAYPPPQAFHMQQRPSQQSNGGMQRPVSKTPPGSSEGRNTDSMRPFQFPNRNGPPPRSQSAMPAADGVPRPIPNRGQTIAPAKPSTGRGPSFGGPLTDSPPSHNTKDFAGAQSRQTSSRSTQKGTTRSSSDEGGTSTTQDAPSLESNTSYEGMSPDSPNSLDTVDEPFVDAPQTFVHQRPRPKRDGEREERAQSRLSMTMDGELQRHEDEVSDQRDSKDRFSALLMGSRPGGIADRFVGSNAAMSDSGRSSQDSQRILKQYQNRTPPPPPQPIKRVREAAPAPKRRNVVRPELVVQGNGWKCLGVGDVDVPNMHNRMVTETIKVPKSKSEPAPQEENAGVLEAEMEEVQVAVRYNDLFELLWTSTTPDVTSRLISHLEMSDLKALRQTSHSVRFALNVQENREIILNQFLAPVGYRTWSQSKSTARTPGRAAAAHNTARDPCPISFTDCEAFLIGYDLLPEYAAVGKEFARHADQMDPRMARLAQASTRAYSRVLTRLRLQPVFKVPSPVVHKTASQAQLRETPTNGSTLSVTGEKDATSLSKHNSYYPGNKGQTSPMLNGDTKSHLGEGSAASGSYTPTVSSPLSTTSSNEAELAAATPAGLVSPWKPGRAAFYRVWVPASDPSGWLSDDEMSQCEAELYKAGIWNFLKRGDVIWDTAVGDKLNEGKYLFDGHYLRDLSYAHDVAGHLPSWLNSILYSPSYWHNIILSTAPRPVIYFDISPWKDQIVGSLRLVQDHVEGYSNNGSRYRIAKWLYRCGANITSGQIVSKMNGALEIVDEGWNGRIIIETEGTAEHAKALVSRCAGPHASPQAKAALLATVMGDVNAARKMLNTSDTQGLNYQAPPTPVPSSLDPKTMAATPTQEVQNSAWMIMRERSRPGLIWIKLAGERAQAG